MIPRHPVEMFTLPVMATHERWGPNGPGAEGQWVDQRGSFMAAVAAGPVFKLLGKKDLGTDEFPAVETGLTDGDLAFRQHKGGHTTGPNWPTFLTFADRYIKVKNAPATSGRKQGAALTTTKGEPVGVALDQSDDWNASWRIGFKRAGDGGPNGLPHRHPVIRSPARSRRPKSRVSGKMNAGAVGPAHLSITDRTDSR